MENTERTPLLSGSGLISSQPHDLYPQSSSSSLSDLSSPHVERPQKDSASLLGTLTDDSLEVAPEDCVDGLLSPKAAKEVEVRLRDPAASSFTASDIEMGDEMGRTYWQRYWVLLLFSALSFYQCSLWSCWGPLSESVKFAYPSWGSTTVAMMASWGTVATVFFVLVTSWFLQTVGLRVGVLTAAALLALGTAMRTLTVDEVAFTVLSHACAICVGIAGTVFISAPPMISALWFAPHERTTATAVSLAANQLGAAGSYVESLLVRQPGTHVTPTEVRDDIRNLMTAEAMIALLLFMLTVAYFPPAPPSPPSITSAIPRLRYREALHSIFGNRDVILLAVSFSIFASVSVAWLSVLNYSLKELGISQDEAVWIGLASTFSSALFGLVSSRVTDLVYGHLRTSLLILTLLSCASFFWFALMTWHTIPTVRWQVYASIASGLSFNFAMTPIFTELAVETAYPCPEIVVAGCCLTLDNVLASSFLFIFFFENSGYSWVTFCLLASSSLCALPLLMVREDYARSSIDRHDPNLSSRERNL